ncbi:lipid A-modifier LpxR family protein [Oceanobacter mangrovi]|uniref:lipid A-modifier LpxR family protein n=1 Tax=Oceanobacter mangrovi TaxID=2862510 RepID=UPI001C8E2583|nr:lipid A-modifier LpxR family protein [Oceanobacter mangrovi]
MRSFLLLLLFFSDFAISLDDSYSLLGLLVKDGNFERRYVDDVPKVWQSSIQNDALTGDNITDQYFTNAIQLSGYSSLREGFLYQSGRLYGFRCGPDDGSADDYADCDDAPRSGLQNRDLKLVRYGYTMAHELYTPYQDAGVGKVEHEGYEHIENAAYYDRPFAAWAYWGRTLRLDGVDGYDDHQLTVGVVGPAAAGRWVQETAHQYPFSGAYPITGWETQVDNRLALQYSGKFAAHWIHQEGRFGEAYVSHFPFVEAGSIINRLGYGVEASLLVSEGHECRRYRSGDLFYINTLAQSYVALDDKLAAYAEQLRGYLAANRVSDSVLKHMLVLVDRIEAFIAVDHPLADVYSELDEVQHQLALLNQQMSARVVSACFPAGWYSRLTASVTGHYVISNYLLEGGIHIPADTDPDSDLQIMREGGTRNVHLKRWIASASVGVMAGWQDHFGIGARYHYRTEETLEQVEQHRWAEFVIEGKSNWAAAFIPLLIGGLALARMDEWPD